MRGSRPRPRDKPLVPGQALPQPQAISYAAKKHRDHNIAARGNEIEELLENQSQAGGGFRCSFYFLIFLTVACLVFMKIDKDFLVPDVPEEKKKRAATEFRTAADELYEELQLKGGRAKTNPDDPDLPNAPPVDDVSAEELKQRYEEQRENLEKCVGGDKAECQKKSRSLTLKFNQVSSLVEHDYYDLLKVSAGASPSSIKRAYEEAKSNPNLDSKALTQLKEAHDMLMHPETRAYYNLYLMKPPERMRHVSARHGGWGMEWGLGTHKFRLFEAWLAYFKHNIFAQLFFVGLFLIPTFFSVYPRLHQILKLAERMEKNWTNDSDEDD